MTKPAEPFVLTTSRGFTSWMERAGGSLAFTTYQAGKLFLLGLRADGRQHVSERTFARCMGLAVSADARQLCLATHYQIYRFENLLPPVTKGPVTKGPVTKGPATNGPVTNGPATKSPDGADAVFVPRLSWITGDLDVHDVAIGPDGNPVFVATQFNCLATTSGTASFRPLWRPPFISALVAEDRCHLNGMATDRGVPRYVTAVATSDVSDGWRDRRTGGGVVIDVASGEVVCAGLSMPHSPRLHDGSLWIVNSGTGEFGRIDIAAGRFEPVAFCPGYARGLTFAGGSAVIGLSLARENRTFQGLPLDDALAAKNTDARCGLIMVDLATGTTAAWVRIEGVVRELFDVAFLPGLRQPNAIGFKSDEIARLISIEG